MERLTNKKEADTQRRTYEKRLEQGYPRNIPEERFLRLAAYEDTGLEPKEITTGKELAEVACALNLLKRYQALGPIEELTALVEVKTQHKAYRLDGFYCYICAKEHLRVVEVDGIYLTRAEAEAALQRGAEK